MGNQGAIWRGLEKAPDDMDKAVGMSDFLCRV